MSEKDKSDWFKAWFNSPYYHKLYDNRNDAEAEEFIHQLVNYLNLDKSATVLDLACGDGRHCRVFANKGFDVTGIDLAPESIKVAKEKSGPHQRYGVADMRTFDLHRKFDLITNLFTSFGYFDSSIENSKVLGRIHTHLQPNGIFVLDFLNLTLLERTLVANEVIEKGGVRFNISRKIEGGRIIKKINFDDNGNAYEHTEFVQALSIDELTSLFVDAGFKILATFGDYFLNEYIRAESPRVILVATKA
ncbi:MAG: methyltransferase domain-containing protein [Cryomorphaceae bacterium]|nr:methyltransferase domain-containing protein [Cryomorphaceae bacterium]